MRAVQKVFFFPFNFENVEVIFLPTVSSLGRHFKFFIFFRQNLTVLQVKRKKRGNETGKKKEGGGEDPQLERLLLHLQHNPFPNFGLKVQEPTHVSDTESQEQCTKSSTCTSTITNTATTVGYCSGVNPFE